MFSKPAIAVAQCQNKHSYFFNANKTVKFCWFVGCFCFFFLLLLLSFLLFFFLFFCKM